MEEAKTVLIGAGIIGVLYYFKQNPSLINAFDIESTMLILLVLGFILVLRGRK
jgi:hypothetical protein